MDALAGLWDVVNDNGAGLAALAAIATAVVAVGTLWSARLDSRERSRPMVLAEFRRAEHSDNTIDLVIRNAGASIARDVSVRFNPVPVVPPDSDRNLTTYLLRRYEEQMPTLAPGQKLTNIWFAGRDPAPDGSGELLNHEPTPDAVTVTIGYRGVGRRRYVDRFPLHVDLIRMTTYATSSTSLPGRIQSIEESLRSLTGSGKRMARAVESLLPETD